MEIELDLIQLRKIIFKTAYQMLGEIAEAEDISQELTIDYSEKLKTNELDSVKNIMAYYVRAAINRSINLLKRKKRLEYPGIWLPEPVLVVENELNAQIDISYGFVHLLTKLNPKERGVFILRESFEMSFKEIAEDLELEYDHCRKLHQRGKQKLKAESLHRSTDVEKQEALTSTFLQAVQGGNMEELISFLREDIVIYSDGGGKVAAARNPLYGPEICAKFILGLQKKAPQDLRVEVRSTAQGVFVLLFEGQSTVVQSAMNLDIFEGKIQRIFIQRNPDKLRLF